MSPQRSHVTHKEVMSFTNDSCLSQMSHVSTKESRLSQTSHVSHKEVMFLEKESCLSQRSHVSHKRVTSHIYASCLSQRSHVSVCATGWRRLIGSLIFVGHFQQKRSIFSGSFEENDLQLRGSYESSPPCTPTSSTPRSNRVLMSHVSHKRVTFKCVMSLTKESCLSVRYDRLKYATLKSGFDEQKSRWEGDSCYPVAQCVFFCFPPLIFDSFDEQKSR